MKSEKDDDQKIGHALRSLHRLRAPEDFESRLFRRIRKKDLRGREKRLFTNPLRFSILTTVVVMVVGVLGYYSVFYTLSTPGGDGGSVIVNEKSEEFPSGGVENGVGSVSDGTPKVRRPEISLVRPQSTEGRIPKSDAAVPSPQSVESHSNLDVKTTQSAIRSEEAIDINVLGAEVQRASSRQSQIENIISTKDSAMIKAREDSLRAKEESADSAKKSRKK